MKPAKKTGKETYSHENRPAKETGKETYLHEKNLQNTQEKRLRYIRLGHLKSKIQMLVYVFDDEHENILTTLTL